MAILEIRTYRFNSRGWEQFQTLLEGEVGVLLREHGIRVVRHGPSLDDPRGYVLIRAYASLAERQEQEDRFYGSDAWRSRYREDVLAAIETYLDAVLDVDDDLVEALGRL